jgi:hypothetical protein
MFAAYKYVIVAVMISEASFEADKLGLPLQRHPLGQSSVQFETTTPPNVMYVLGAGGRIDTDRYSFCFGRHKRFIVKLDRFGHLDQAEENEMLSRGTSLVSSNGAYQLATNWLSAIQVDVWELQRTNQAEVQQRWYYGPQGKTMLPVFEVRWGEWDHPKIEVSIDGRTKEVVYIRQEDDSFSRRPEELIKNLDKLLEIPDDEFEKYSPIQRSNLFAQYAVVDYQHPEGAPTSLSHRYDITNNYELVQEKYSALGKYLRRARESKAEQK